MRDPTRILSHTISNPGLADRQLPSGRVVRPNQHLVQRGKEPAIVWSADDKNNTFEHKGIVYSVAEYFDKVKGIKLRYPKMPVLNVGKYGFNPAEFFFQVSELLQCDWTLWPSLLTPVHFSSFQAFGRAKGANAPDQVLRVLGFYDDYAGEKRVEQLTKSMRALKAWAKKSPGREFDSLSSQFNFCVDDSPEVVPAKVLEGPVLSFGGHGRGKTENGSWRLTKDGNCALPFKK